jgi:heme exporter protein B
MLYLGKMIGNFFFMVIMEIIIIPLMIILFNLDILNILLPLLLIVLLGTLGFAAVGTLLSAISVNTRAREILLPVLLFPIAIPILLAAVKATGVLINEGTFASAQSWIRILAGFDIIFLVISSLLFEYVVED